MAPEPHTGHTHGLSPFPEQMPWRPNPVITPKTRKTKWVVSAVGAAGVLCSSVYLVHHKWGRGSTNPADDSQRHITFRPVGTSLSYVQAVELMEEAARSGDWRSVQDRLLERDVRWTGYVVESKPPEYHVIRPWKGVSGKKWEEAIITLSDRTAHAAYAKNECITVAGSVHRIDSKGIDIADATIEAAN